MESKKDKNRQESRQKCAEIFKDTYEKCQNNSKLKESILQSIKFTKLYVDGNKFIINDTIKSENYNIIITPDRTLEAVYKYYIPKETKGKTGVLNFASAKNPGGGVFSGARSQEESICRASTLYPCLNTEFLNDNYYSYHKYQKKDYSDRIIYIPNVLVFKSDTDVYSQMLEENKWYNIDVISCAAHNQRAYKLDHENLKKLVYSRLKAIIECGVENNVDNLILGAYGCGAFGNDPQLVSKIFKNILIDEEYYKYFLKVHFAIFTMSNEVKNLNEFNKTFEKYLVK